MRFAVSGAALDDPPVRRRVGFAAALTVSMAVGPLTVYSLTALGPLVVADLGLSGARFGFLATLVFVVAALLSGVAGAAVDRFGTRAPLLAVYLTAGSALAALAVARSYEWLLVAVAVSGVAQSLANPVTNQLIAEQVPEGRRGALTGVKQGGVQLSQIFAGLAVGDRRGGRDGAALRTPGAAVSAPDDGQVDRTGRVRSRAGAAHRRPVPARLRAPDRRVATGHQRAHHDLRAP
ncbi:hypothetical protein Pen02_35600 [Plantactinospora endophytica]|uniref:Major facilitator superfamily (MFS) profile domain-containing protein n=1 Tax=Plantactinospora endophytica TaxID=673535 RepID=A0ABQ4E1N5_9ACTN|nr:hypothetical protein Pen02_35600 [Plantactinospora endophytica]